MKTYFAVFCRIFQVIYIGPVLISSCRCQTGNIKIINQNHYLSYSIISIFNILSSLESKKDVLDKSYYFYQN